MENIKRAERFEDVNFYCRRLNDSCKIFTSCISHILAFLPYLLKRPFTKIQKKTSIYKVTFVISDDIKSFTWSIDRVGRVDKIMDAWNVKQEINLYV